MTGLDTEQVASARRFAGNAFWLLVAQAAGKLASFAFVVIVARGLGTEAYGEFNFAASFVPLFLVFGTLGLDVAVVRQVVRSRERLSEVFSSGLLLRGGVALVGLAGAVALAPFLVESTRAFVVVAVLGGALFLDELSGYLGAVYKAFERVAFHGMVLLANRIVSTLLALVAIAMGGDILAVCGTYLAGSLGALGFAWVALRRYFPPVDLRDARAATCRSLLREGLPLALANALNAALFRIDAVLLQAIKGPVAVGLYGVAYRFFESFLFVAWSLTNVALPRLARAGPDQRAGRTFQLTVALMLSFYLPVAAGAPFAAEWVVTALFSDEYRSAASTVPWLTGAAALYAVAYLARVGAIAVGRRRGIVWIAGGSLVLNVALNLAVIPRYSFQGAAVATFATEVVEAALLLMVFVRASGRPQLERVVLVPVAAAAVMLAGLLASGARDAVAVVVGGALYGLALPVCARLLAPADSRRALQLVRRRLKPTPASEGSGPT